MNLHICLKLPHLKIIIMAHNLGYFNSSFLDRLSGEYYRSIKEKKDYYIFNYRIINKNYISKGFNE